MRATKQSGHGWEAADVWGLACLLTIQIASWSTPSIQRRRPVGCHRCPRRPHTASQAWRAESQARRRARLRQVAGPSQPCLFQKVDVAYGGWVKMWKCGNALERSARFTACRYREQKEPFFGGEGGGKETERERERKGKKGGGQRMKVSHCNPHRCKAVRR
ncbi:hypothetical protein K504DRAFT_139832 [Pleomassaria siparia CBS 279.74]|uniref:Uncharacterized protein n=1 Tax=Pleomassaria siparia CBS 279.74 TaxID=1314801 RepID=A0A6G1KLX2_9PLEO|nr:hypothetical protein K504DRAFT_139832 [Pleomassaria siparia CBS 279.74]